MSEIAAGNGETITNFPALTAREQEVMDLLLAANSTKEIAYKLNISIKTVEFHKESYA